MGDATGGADTAGRQGAEARSDWSAIAPGAETIAAVQFGLAGIFWIVVIGTRDDYDTGYGGLPAILGLLCACVFAPPVLFVLGTIHAALFTVPAMTLSHAAGVRSGIPAPRWALPVLLLLCAAYAAPVSLALGTSYAAAYGWTAGAGAVPVAVAVAARMRQWPKGRVRRRTLAMSGLAALLTVLAGVEAQVMDVLPQYRPPALAHADYVGEWAGDGTWLVLDEDGSARVLGLPVPDREHEDAGRCMGPGTWSVRQVNRHRPGIALSVPDCPRAALTWGAGGTTREPELFVMLGDPDGGELRVLRKRAGR
ncbi:hypothetical protein SAVIM338S_03293 [Streptomyces avidinii]